MAETYFGDLSVGDKILYEGEACTVTGIEGIPLTEDEYYGPAQPDRKIFTVEFGDGSEDEFTRWESDVVIMAETRCLQCKHPAHTQPCEEWDADIPGLPDAHPCQCTFRLTFEEE